MLKARTKLGKYRIVKRLARGGFADVFEARDTVEGIKVALKVPHDGLVTPEMLETFRKEVRLTARLDHPNILHLKSAGQIDGHFVIAQPLAPATLADRLKRRLSVAQALDFTEQLLAALDHAHSQNVIHCDVKPDNVLIFKGNRLRLMDFGISRVALHTVAASGAGTLGYMAPEQAMGKPSKRSDVFSVGLVTYRMLTGRLPEWPFRKPMPGHERLRHLHPDLRTWLHRALEVDSGKRFRDAGQMLAAWRRIRVRVLGSATRRKRAGPRATPATRDWEGLRMAAFKRRFGRNLRLKHSCSHCEGPVSTAMKACPWCGAERKQHRGDVGFPAACPRCRRGVKLDWTYCPWCHGAAIGPASTRTYSDVRYTARCGHAGCKRRELMPFMRYCPWCRRKVKQHWPIKGSQDKCHRCGWGVVLDEWRTCPWCAVSLERAS